MNKLILALSLSVTCPVAVAYADGVGIGAGFDNTGKLKFVSSHGANSQAALDNAREICIASFEGCKPLVQFDQGCRTLIAGVAPAGVQVFVGATEKEAISSCTLGGAKCLPPVALISECAK